MHTGADHSRHTDTYGCLFVFDIRSVLHFLYEPVHFQPALFRWFGFFTGSARTRSSFLIQEFRR
ncbi:hypothetical protein DMH01_32560 [Amycolatopsis sp. WAC 04182]|nr:hypothetical protein DMH01_32560 [Amycolatopsis sp. WAC 04182]